MSLLSDNDDRFKHLFLKAAVFILIAVLGMGGVFLWTGIKKGAFTPKSPLYFVADSGQDLKEGIPVKFSGFKIGKLTSLALDEKGQVQVELEIDSKYLNLLRQDAVVSLKKEGVIGDGVLDISHGTEDKPLLVAGSRLRFERANGLEQAVLEMKNRVMPILEDVHQLLSDPQGDLRQTLQNVRQLTGELSHASTEMKPLLQSLRATAANSEGLTSKVNQELPQMLKKVDGSLDHVLKTTETIQQAIQQSAPQIPDVMGKTREVLGSTQEVVDGLSNTWPLKGVVRPVEMGPVRMDSHD